jgi:hypothetical protein
MIKPSIVALSAPLLSKKFAEEGLLYTILAAMEQIKHKISNNTKFTITYF